MLARQPLYLPTSPWWAGFGGDAGGSGIGSLVLGLVGSGGDVLSYGTTARAASLRCRQPGDAVTEGGPRATWLALGLGALVVVVVETTATPLVGDRWRWHHRRPCRGCGCDHGHAGDRSRSPATAGCAACGHRATALRYVIRQLRVRPAVPLLVCWLGFVPLGLAGSAVNLVGQWLAALLFAGALLAEAGVAAAGPRRAGRPADGAGRA